MQKAYHANDAKNQNHSCFSLSGVCASYPAIMNRGLSIEDPT